nr:hypothetical protein OG409_35915 [Streptomyces sp. NBC_00974]
MDQPPRICSRRSSAQSVHPAEAVGNAVARPAPTSVRAAHCCPGTQSSAAADIQPPTDTDDVCAIAAQVRVRREPQPLKERNGIAVDPKILTFSPPT